ncbi:MAG TPA: GH92 family glycosyl hydrolase [Terracidiphilus sp.]|nr:GH92 family glycosyl hydrolase [Terracidiphilus sp.]
MKDEEQLDTIGLDRRTFIKSSGLAMATALFEPKAGAVSSAGSAVRPRPGAAADDPLGLVNVLQGTESTRVFSRGNTLPIAAMPFGMAHWTIQSDSNTAWMFQPGERRLQGFRCTHQLSPWLSDYGQAIFLPVCGNPDPDASMRSCSWLPEQAVLRPYSFRLGLPRYEADVEVIPTERCALMTARFSGSAPPAFMLEIPGHDGDIDFDKSTRSIRFTSTINEGGVPPNFATYYVVRLDTLWDTADARHLPHSRVGIARYKAGNYMEARIATSFISFEQAQRNLDRELGTRSADRVRSEGEAAWRTYFSRVEIQGGNLEQRKTFYSCLYRALLFPRIWHEPDASGKPHHLSPYSGDVTPGVMYADHGYWDTYRAWYPLMALLYPERLGEILQAWVNAYAEGGWLPQFPAPGYRACMTGSLIDSVFGDAAAKRIQGFDLNKAYEGLKKHATQPGDPDRGYGRRGIEDYLKLGYVTADHVSQSVAETVDAAYGDFCIAQVAKALGHNDDFSMFLKRSQNWRYVFEPGSGFLRGKHADGTWLEPFDQFAWGSPYVEGSAWQHRWDVPQDIPGYIAAMGGNQRAVDALEKMLAIPPTFHVGVYGQEIHEMSEMAAVSFGQYAQSNQPVHHLLYIFALAGRPDRTQYWVRRVMAELYSPDKFPGDEDTGSMAAWYMFGALGFYPVCPGKAEYVLGVPLFERAVLHLPGAKATVIETRGNDPSAPYVSKLAIDGKAHTLPTVSHDEITSGANLVFFLQDKPAA